MVDPRRKRSFTRIASTPDTEGFPAMTRANSFSPLKTATTPKNTLRCAVTGPFPVVGLGAGSHDYFHIHGGPVKIVGLETDPHDYFHINGGPFPVVGLETDSHDYFHINGDWLE